VVHEAGEGLEERLCVVHDEGVKEGGLGREELKCGGGGIEGGFNRDHDGFGVGEEVLELWIVEVVFVE
jgi:hypothetical protein